MARPLTEIQTKRLNAWTLTNTGANTATVRTYDGVRRVYTGSLTPGYYNLAQSKNQLPYRNHSVSLIVTSDALVRQFHFYAPPSPTWDVREDRFQNLFPGSSWTAQTWAVSHSSQAMAQAKDRCIRKVKDSSINAAQAVAEVQKTIDLVGDTAHSLAKSFLLIKKGKFGKAMQALGVKDAKTGNFSAKKSLAQNWLAAQYGWLPLLSDIDGACKQLAKKPLPPYFVCTGKATARDSSRNVFTSSAGGGGVDSSETGYISTAKASMTFAMRNYSVKTMSELGITDPAHLAWELLPYSFVVDWFYPVGNYLQHLNYTDGLTFVRGYTVQHSVNRWSHRNRGFSSTGGGQTTQWYATNFSNSENLLFHRVALTGPLAVSLPKIKNPLSTTHLANGLALLVSAFR